MSPTSPSCKSTKVLVWSRTEIASEAMMLKPSPIPSIIGDLFLAINTWSGSVLSTSKKAYEPLTNFKASLNAEKASKFLSRAILPIN